MLKAFFRFCINDKKDNNAYYMKFHMSKGDYTVLKLEYYLTFALQTTLLRQ